MTLDARAQTVRAYLHAALQEDAAASLEDLIADEDCRRFLLNTSSWLRMLFTGLQISIEEQFTCGDRVVTRVTFQGTHTGSWQGLQPTDRRVTWTGIAIDRFENGKIIEMRHEADIWGMMKQIGAV